MLAGRQKGVFRNTWMNKHCFRFWTYLYGDCRKSIRIIARVLFAYIYSIKTIQIWCPLIHTHTHTHTRVLAKKRGFCRSRWDRFRRFLNFFIIIIISLSPQPIFSNVYDCIFDGKTFAIRKPNGKFCVQTTFSANYRGQSHRH